MSKALFIFILFICSLSAFAETFSVKPYLVLGEKNNISLNFKTLRDAKLNVEIKSSGLRINKSSSYLQGEMNKIDLGKLSCGKTVHYRFIDEQRTPLIEAGTIAIPCNKSAAFYIGFMSDTQIKNQAGQARANELASLVAELKQKYPFPLIINAGDIVQHGGRESEWLNYFKTSEAYLGSSYLVSAIGNHEYYESEHMDQATPEFLSYMRDSHSSQLGNLAIDVGPITMLVINSNFKFLTEAKIKEQWDWLEAKLTRAQQIKRPVFISLHHSPFSSSAEWIREIPKRLREEFVPLIEKYSCVKAVLSGHLHMYERSYKQGIHYLIAGPSGGILNAISYINPHKVVAKPFLTTFTLLKVQNDVMTAETYDIKKGLVDKFEMGLKVQ